MAPRTQQQRMVIDRLAGHLLETGLSRTSLRELAGAAGVSDRMLVYYFGDKESLLAACFAEVGQALTAELAAAIPAGTRLPPGELMARAAAVTTAPAMRPYLRLWVEAVAAAAKRQQPYLAISAQVMAGFMSWVEERLELPPGADVRATATAIIALIDGLALVEICVGAEDAARAAAALSNLAPGTRD